MPKNLYLSIAGLWHFMLNFSMEWGLPDFFYTLWCNPTLLLGRQSYD